MGHSDLNLGFTLRKLEKSLERIEERSKHNPNSILIGSLYYFVENSMNLGRVEAIALTQRVDGSGVS